ncbi:Dihydrodipicolinate synthase [Hyphodiscus hymeniophilus]|uniref:Dihydrodipicolinate synthase n=1 Tax=Hyphodiscus hymeniophilus TaxID=353542 RepID=A0A9P7AXM4_9HELO|nr:Dihydrodipicolinate synthase [Hyphodiscus hymeniophilus]
MTVPTNGTSNGKGPFQQDALKPGVYVPTVAFFSPVTEEVDLVTTAKHAIRLARSGVAGIVTQGSNGEAVHLDHAERMAITQTTRDALDSISSTIPVIVGCGAQSTRETIKLCKEAASSGGTYALILPPNYYGSLLSTSLIIEHFRAVADASPVPLLIYNYPGACSGLDLSSDTIITLSSHPNIVGVKLTCGNTGKLARIVAGASPSFATFGGSADFTLQTLIVGGHGVIAGTANIAPKACASIMELYYQGKLDEAKRVQQIVARGDWVAIRGGFISVKTALEAFEGYGGGPRSPCVAPGNAEATTQKKEFAELMAFERSL